MLRNENICYLIKGILYLKWMYFDYFNNRIIVIWYLIENVYNYIIWYFKLYISRCKINKLCVLIF